MRLCSSLGLELMVKLSTLLTIFTFILKAKTHDYGKGRYISDLCLWCSANHNALHWVSWPIRADCACLKEGLCRKQSVWEAGHRGPTIMYSIWKIMCFLNMKSCQHILLHQIHKIMIFKIALFDPLNIHGNVSLQWRFVIVKNVKMIKMFITLRLNIFHWQVVFEKPK